MRPRNTSPLNQILAALILSFAICRPLFAAAPTAAELADRYTGSTSVAEITAEPGAEGQEALLAFAAAFKGQKLPFAGSVELSTTGSPALKFGIGESSFDVIVQCKYSARSGELTGKQRVTNRAAEITYGIELVDTYATFVAPEGKPGMPPERSVVIAGSYDLIVVASKVDKIQKVRFKFSVTSDSTKGPDPEDPTDDPKFGNDSGARFSSLSREVEIFRWKDGAWDFAEFATPQSKILVGDKVIVREASNAVITFGDLSTLTVRPIPNGDDAEIIIAVPPDRGGQIDLLKGRLWLNIKKIIAGEAIEVKSDQAVLGPKGTVFVVEATADETGCKVIEGSVEVKHRATGKAVTISAGQQVSVKPAGIGNVTPFDVEKEREFESASTATAESYRHSAGAYRLPIPPGWQLLSNMRNKLADRASDTLKDASGQFVIILRKQAEPVDKPDVVFHRWMAAAMTVDKSLLDPNFNRLQVSRIQLGPIHGLRLTYFLPTQQVVSRMAFAHEGQWFVINTVSPQEFGTAELPAKIMEVLGKLETIPASAKNRERSPPNLGRELLKLETLDGLTRDFGVTVFENAAVVRDHVRGVEQIVRVNGPGFPILSGAEGFLKRDPAILQQLGEPLSPEVAVFNYRLGVQLFRGGIVIHDPVESLLLQTGHTPREKTSVAIGNGK